MVLIYCCVHKSFLNLLKLQVMSTTIQKLQFWNRVYDLEYFVYDVYFMEKLSEPDRTTKRTSTTLGLFETETMRASKKSQCKTTTGAFDTSEETILTTERFITALH